MKKKKEMVNALQEELKMRASELGDVAIETIYFGGGTPSLLSSDEIRQLTDIVFENFKVVEDPEISLEANPDDLHIAYLEELVNTPVNRLSIGIQSFHDRDLKLMNRAHDSELAVRAMYESRKRFDNISVDLIYGIPGLTDTEWLANIEKALEYDIPHISAYALTVEPKTALASFISKGVVPELDEDQAMRQFYMLLDILEGEGFQNYELSNFGKPGLFSKNNVAYWTGKPYLGIGPSAHSFDGKQRKWNISNNVLYIKSLQSQNLPLTVEELSVTDRYNERIMTGLRTMWGVSLSAVESDFGKPFKSYLLEQAEDHIQEHLLYIDSDNLLVSRKGKFLSDGLASNLFKLNLS